MILLLVVSSKNEIVCKLLSFNARTCCCSQPKKSKHTRKVQWVPNTEHPKSEIHLKMEEIVKDLNVTKNFLLGIQKI